MLRCLKNYNARSVNNAEQMGRVWLSRECTKKCAKVRNLKKTGEMMKLFCEEIKLQIQDSDRDEKGMVKRPFVNK